MNDYNHPFNILSRFQEKRADISAAVGSLQDANCYREYINHFIQHPTTNPPTHPTDSEGLAFAKQMMQHHMA